jgi:hypothetical protein
LDARESHTWAGYREASTRTADILSPAVYEIELIKIILAEMDKRFDAMW